MSSMARAESEPKALLRSRFGLADFRPGQLEVIDSLVTRGAALAVFPTGGGKSLCYQLPAIAFDGVTVVVSPLIALMKDQIDYLLRLGIPAARLDSSLRTDEVRDAAQDLRSGRLRLLYVAPERFNNESFLSDLRRVPIALFAVDEAHCISEWGHNFRPDYLKLEHQLVEIRTSEARLRFTRVDSGPLDAESLVSTLAQRFERREQQEISRIQHVLELVTHPGCQTAAVVGYFGETLHSRCGHCTFCQTARPQSLSPSPPTAPIESLLDVKSYDDLRNAYPAALSHPRQQARFLCGLTSPALARTRLSSHVLFGTLAQHRFADVLEWCVAEANPHTAG